MAGRSATSTAAAIDTQSVKTTESGGPSDCDAGKKVEGRKCHLVVDVEGLLIETAVHEASVQDRDGVHLTFFGEVCLSPTHLVRFRRWVRLMTLGQATIEALETPNPYNARKREIKSTKKHETHPSARGSGRDPRHAGEGAAHQENLGGRRISRQEAGVADLRQGRRRERNITVETQKGSPFPISAGSWSGSSLGCRAADVWRKTTNGAWRILWRGRS